MGGEVGGGLKERARENERDDSGNDRETSIYEEKKRKSRVYTRSNVSECA